MGIFLNCETLLDAGSAGPHTSVLIPHPHHHPPPTTHLQSESFFCFMNSLWKSKLDPKKSETELTAGILKKDANTQKVKENAF